MSDLCVAVLKIEFFDLGVDCLWGKTYQWSSFSFDSFVIVLLMKVINEIHIMDFHNTHSNDVSFPKQNTWILASFGHNSVLTRQMPEKVAYMYKSGLDYLPKMFFPKYLSPKISEQG